MADEEKQTTEEVVEETVAETETSESEAEPEKTAQETQPEKEVEKTYTSTEVDDMFQKRAVRDYRKARREIEEEYKNHPQEKQPEPVTAEPNFDDFDDTKEWMRAFVKWERKEEIEREATQSRQVADTEEAAKIRRNFSRQQDRFEDTHPDYLDAMDTIKGYELPAYVNEAVMTSDIGAELSYHLAKNHLELEKILDMQPSAAVRAIGRLEVKLEAKPEPKEVSKLPEPIEPLKGGSEQASTTYKSGDDTEQFMKVRYLELGRGKKR